MCETTSAEYHRCKSHTRRVALALRKLQVQQSMKLSLKQTNHSNIESKLMLSYDQCDPMFGHLRSESVFSWFATRLLGCRDLKARINLNQFRSSRWQLAVSLTMTKTYKTKEQGALQTDSICADLCWHQNYFQINEPSKLKTLKKKCNNGTTQHNNATQPLLGVCSFFEFTAICKGTVTLLRITTSKVSPVTT